MAPQFVESPLPSFPFLLLLEKEEREREEEKTKVPHDRVLLKIVISVYLVYNARDW
jgi:hypothetical protein